MQHRGLIVLNREEEVCLFFFGYKFYNFLSMSGVSRDQATCQLKIGQQGTDGGNIIGFIGDGSLGQDVTLSVQEGGEQENRFSVLLLIARLGFMVVPWVR
ncbi:MAG: hypothetical protein HQL92_01350 [Magnetococcales bacterium]|nr:hypothetical protein [Magnetococcales bacterium]